MTTSSSPALASFWAERIILVVPGRDSKPAKVHEDPQRLREILGLLPSPGRFTFLLTQEAKVSSFVQLLRSYSPKSLAGSIAEHEWLLPALDFVVATPEQAHDYWASGRLSDCDVKAVLLDADCSALQACQFGSRFAGLASPTLVERRQWFVPEARARPTQMLRTLAHAKLPEAMTCDGWGDSVFIQAVNLSCLNKNVVVRDWSGAVALLPSLVRDFVEDRSGSSPSSLLLAPSDKVETLSQLLQACAQDMGVCNLPVGGTRGHRLLVTSPDMILPHHFRRLIVVEVDRLLQDLYGWKIEQLLKLCTDSPVALHASSLTPAVQGLIRKLSFTALPQPGLTLDHVCHFFRVVRDEEDKLESVCRIWSQLELSRRSSAIFCNSAQSVDKVAGALTKRGFTAFAVHKGSQVKSEAYDKPFAVIVTNQFSRGAAQQVINYEPAYTSNEYLQRVGMDRNKHFCRVVINVGTGGEVLFLKTIAPGMVQLPDDCRNIHKMLPMWFRV